MRDPQQARRYYQESEKGAAVAWQWWYKAKGERIGVSEKDWEEWKEKVRKVHCVFCGWHVKAIAAKAYRGCPECKEYEGIEPCLKETCRWRKAEGGEG